MSLQIVHYNAPILHQKGDKITTFDDEFRTLSAEMIATMHDSHGIGLAAQQIGRALQLCVVDLRQCDIDFDWALDGAKPPLDLFMPMVIANPKITIHENTDQYILEEGCLSFPDIRGDVTRPDEITVKFQDEHGVDHTLICNDLLSRCIQHEADHLKGTLFIDRMTKKVRATIDREIKALALETKADSQGALDPI